MKRPLISLVFGLLVMPIALAPAGAAETCEALRAEIEAAGADADADALAAAFEESLRLGDCSDAFRSAVGRRAAVAVLKGVLQKREAGEDAAAYSADLERSLTYYRLWQTLALLGEISFGGGDFTAATIRFQEALEAIDDEELTRTPPDRERIEKLFRQAEETRLVAKEYASLPHQRGGRPRALSDPDIRGFKPESTAWPITFQSGSAELSGKGRDAVEDLFVQMSYEDFPDITLIGYTDERGSERRNMALSVRRAEAVAAYLRQKGYTGAISVEGRGETAPYVPLDASVYQTGDLHLMNRRVDVRR